MIGLSSIICWMRSSVASMRTIPWRAEARATTGRCSAEAAATQREKMVRRMLMSR